MLKIDRIDSRFGNTVYFSAYCNEKNINYSSQVRSFIEFFKIKYLYYELLIDENSPKTKISRLRTGDFVQAFICSSPEAFSRTIIGKIECILSDYVEIRTFEGLHYKCPPSNILRKLNIKFEELVNEKN